MPVSKIKNLIILILLAATGFLLALVIPNKLAQSQQRQAQHAQLSALYDSYGIALSEEILPQEQNLFTIELPDTQTGGSTLAAALLQTPVSMPMQASRDSCSYAGENGTLSYQSSGLLRVELKNSGEIGNLRNGAKKLLRSLDFEVYAISEPERISAGVFRISCAQAIFGVPVFSEPLDLSYTNNCLTQMDGMFFFGAKDAARVDDTPCISCSDALVALLSQRDRLGWVASRIVSVRQGYRHIGTASSSIRMAPCWEIVTDAGSFFVNGIYGEVTAAD